ncbi:hypothetical protein QFZ58_002523 [Streptomyces sp. B1I3]|nr:hypothetical protein [Streptomyces sp. B1I3]
MELAYYSDYAVRLVNTEEPARNKDSLTTVESVRELFGANAQAARRATDADVTRFRSVRARLRAVFQAADGGDETLAVDLLNSLLLEFPVSPQISGHDARDEDGKPDWHMHLADHPSNATAGFAAIAAMGLAFHLTSHGVDRLGLCEAAPCRNAYLDTSTNRVEALLLGPLCDQGQRGRLPGPQAPGDGTVRGNGPQRGHRPAQQPEHRPLILAQRTVARPHPGQYQLLGHRPVVRAVPARERVVAQHPPAAAAPFGGALDHQQVLLERMAQDHHIPRPHRRPVLHQQPVPVVERGHHRGPRHLHHLEPPPGRPPVPRTLRRFRHP